MLARLIKMPKITAKSGETIDATTSPVDKMNPDYSLPIHFPFFVKSFLFLQSWFRRRKQNNRFFVCLFVCLFFVNEEFR